MTTFADVRCACLPAALMPRLAPLRGRHGVEVALDQRSLWVRWAAGDDASPALLFAFPEIRLFLRKGDHWYDWRRAVPAFDVPESLRYRPLDQVVFPSQVVPIPADDGAIEPMPLTLVPDDTPRPAAAMICSLAAMRTWAEETPACVLVRYRAAMDGGRLFVLGKKLPWLDGGRRYWGTRVLVPLGLRPDPVLSEESLRRTVGVGASDLLVLNPDGCDVIAQDHFAPLSHAALRIEEAAR